MVAISYFPTVLIHVVQYHTSQLYSFMWYNIIHPKCTHSCHGTISYIRNSTHSCGTISYIPTLLIHVVQYHTSQLYSFMWYNIIHPKSTHSCGTISYIPTILIHVVQYNTSQLYSFMWYNIIHPNCTHV